MGQLNEDQQRGERERDEKLDCRGGAGDLKRRADWTEQGDGGGNSREEPEGPRDEKEERHQRVLEQKRVRSPGGSPESQAQRDERKHEGEERRVENQEWRDEFAAWKKRAGEEHVGQEDHLCEQNVPRQLQQRLPLQAIPSGGGDTAEGSEKSNEGYVREMKHERRRAPAKLHELGDASSRGNGQEKACPAREKQQEVALDCTAREDGVRAGHEISPLTT